MGLGIWSMHYIGMLAFSLPVPVSYDWPTVMLSLRGGHSSLGRGPVRREPQEHEPVARGGRKHCHGRGNRGDALHRAWRLCVRRAMCHYDARLVALVGRAGHCDFVCGALAGVSARGEKKGHEPREKSPAPAVMGAAIPVMHYTGMAAASFMADGHGSGLVARR